MRKIRVNGNTKYVDVPSTEVTLEGQHMLKREYPHNQLWPVQNLPPFAEIQYKLLIENYMKANVISGEHKLNDQQLADIMLDINLAKQQSLFQYFHTQQFRITQLPKHPSSCTRSIALAVYGGKKKAHIDVSRDIFQWFVN